MKDRRHFVASVLHVNPLDNYMTEQMGAIERIAYDADQSRSALGFA